MNNTKRIALIDESNTVVNLILVKEEDINESLINSLNEIHKTTTHIVIDESIQDHKDFAAAQSTYVDGKFYPRKPSPSMIWDNGCWVPPQPRPENSFWDESKDQWVLETPVESEGN